MTTAQETGGPPEPDVEPLDVPQRALEVDLAQAFGQLLFRASLLQRLRDDEGRAARSAQRDLLGLLVEVDDALAALGLDPVLVRLGRTGGIEATRRRLLGKLAKAGVRPMRPEGMAADPVLSEIVGTEPRAGVEPETVVQSVVTGFFWNDEVLRRAQVVVATPPAGDEGAGPDRQAEPQEAPGPVPDRAEPVAETAPPAETGDGTTAAPARRAAGRTRQGRAGGTRRRRRKR